MGARVKIVFVLLAVSLTACLSLTSNDEHSKPDAGQSGSGGSSVGGGGGFPYDGGGGASATGGTGGTAATGGTGGASGSGGSGGSGGGCVPLTCASQGLSCGASNDGCGATLDCGACATGQACDANGQCLGIAGTWTANYSACDGVTDPPDPTLTITWTIAPGVLKTVISDTDCTITDFGTINYTPTTLTASFDSRTCSTEGCMVGQANAVCASSSSTGTPIDASYTLPDAQHLLIQYPGGPGTGCATGQTQTVHFSR